MPLMLLLLLLAASHGYAAGDTYDSSMCLQKPIPCGNVSISYPFYFSNSTKDLNGYSNSYCGYPGMAVECDDGKPMMQLDGPDKYLVKNISYGNYYGNLSLADPVVLEDTNSCPKVDHNVTIPLPSWLYFPAMSVDYLVFFLDCSFTTPIVQPLAIYQLTCGNLGAGPSFVLPKDKVPEPDYNRYYGNLEQACHKIIEVPILSYTDSSENSAWRSNNYGQILRQGFQLAWNESGRPASCAQCEHSNGRCGYNQEGEFVGCLCPDGQGHSRNCSGSGDSRHSSFKRKLSIIAGISSILFLCLLLACLFCLKKYRYQRISNRTPGIESFLQRNGTLHPKRCTYAEVKKMTKSFAEKLGQGGFGAVYRGNLSDGRQVAVKMLKDSKGDGEEFMNEVASISRTSHVNIVNLLGFCLQGSKRALIYEYMPNGSLERYVFNKNSKYELSLACEKLFDIAIGIARGLEYLHRGCNTRIVHFDIKPHNILLDQDFCPKISDFGMAKLCDNRESIISIGGARGTVGYIAPEVFSKQFGAISSKSDVYSYGMMVLEMVGARERNTDANSESSSHYFPQWIYEHLNEYYISSSEINGETTELVRKMIVVGLWCIQVIPTNRPTMTRVVEMLEGSTIGLKLPPKVLLSL